MASSTQEPTSLQIMSDLHLETPRFFPMYSEFHVTPQAKHLALLGDIGSAHDERLFTFLESMLQQFELVLFVLGNHEPYGSTFEEACEKMAAFERRVERFIFMDRRRLDLNDQVTVLGCTLFSQIRADQAKTASLFVSDFSNISAWTVEAHNAAHARDLAWLNQQVDELSSTDRRIVILTHHSPSVQSAANNPDYVEDPKEIQSAFVTDLSREICWLSPHVKTWAFGHTHWNCDFMDGGKRVLANQRGYGREEIFDFDVGKAISLGQNH